MFTAAMNSQPIGRFSIAMLVAIFVTSVLLFVMQRLIDNDEVSVPPAKPPVYVAFLPRLEEPPVEKKQSLPDPPPKPVAAPTMPTTAFPGVGPGLPIVGPTVAEPVVQGDFSAADGDLLPVMTVPPEYPERQRARGVQGWVLIEFTVDTLGRVQAPRVVSADPARVFDAAALNAVKRYKYKPRVVDGAPRAVTGVRQRIMFTLS